MRVRTRLGERVKAKEKEKYCARVDVLYDVTSCSRQTIRECVSIYVRVCMHACVFLCFCHHKRDRRIFLSRCEAMLVLITNHS